MFILKRFKIFKRENCPCGSGEKYYKCCRERSDEEIDIQHLKKVLLEVSKTFDSHKYETCLHPISTECKPPIKSAHSIQNHGVLSQISHKNHVMGFRTDRTSPFEIIEQEGDNLYLQKKLERIGINDATTHTCFCNYHDSKIFAPIESNPNGFITSDNEQLFLFAYKAFSFEYYKSKVSLIALNNLFKRMPQKFRKYPFLFVPQYREAQLKDNEMEFYKKHFDSSLVNKTFTDIFTEVIEIPFKIEFSSVDCISPLFDLNGRKVKQFSKGLMRRLFLTILPNTDRSYILVSCINEDRKNFHSYISLLKDVSQNNLFEYLSVFLPLYSENLVINPLLLERWGEGGKSAFTSISNLIDKDFIDFDRKFAFNLYKSYKMKQEIPKSSCNLFERL